MMKSLLAAATLAVLAAPALAQPPSGTQPATPATPATPHETPATPAQPAQPATKDDHFAMSDANKDGALSLAEVQKADSKVTQADFDKYDADHSKSLSKVEFRKWAEAKTTPPASAPGQ